MNRMVRVIVLLLPGTAVLLAIGLFFLTSKPYRIVGDDLIGAANSGRGESAEITLTAGVSGGRKWSRELPALDRLVPLWLLVRVRAQTQSLRRGNRNWKMGRADFAFLDPTGQAIRQADHVVMAAEGSMNWRRYWLFFPIPPQAASGVLTLENAGAAGMVRFAGIEAFPAVRKASFTRWRFFLLGLWLTTFLVYLRFLRPWRRPLGWLLLSLIAVILIGAVIPESKLDLWLEGDVRPTLAGGVTTDVFQTFGSGWGGTGRFPLPDTVKDWGHFLLFFLLALLSCHAYGRSPEPGTGRRSPAPFSRRGLVAVFLTLLLFAAATETVQFFVASRHVSLSDWGIDALGITLALLVWWGCLEVCGRGSSRWREHNGDDSNGPPSRAGGA
ncbi:MAG TPA: VanZ family protein [Candidatus Aminicenantes bacterium]|nr:VanZ family protein [Candidatus Aminicenantes bacterium]